MLRGFLASGISRTRSTWSRPFSSEAFFTSTKSASWNTRSKARAAMPRYNSSDLSLPFSFAPFSPLIVSVFSFATMESSSLAKPDTATVMR